MCLAAWRGAQQMAVASGAVVMTAPAFVGYAIERCDDDTESARLLVPEGPVVFVARVHSAFDAIEVEERPLRAVGGGA